MSAQALIENLRLPRVRRGVADLNVMPFPRLTADHVTGSMSILPCSDPDPRQTHDKYPFTSNSFSIRCFAADAVTASTHKRAHCRPLYLRPNDWLHRWAEVVTHVPCGGNDVSPPGRLLIEATLDAIDGVGGVLGFAGPTLVWSDCPTVSLEGVMTFDIADVEILEDLGIFEGVILHEMGHVIGIG